jgi:hypothetical protein
MLEKITAVNNPLTIIAIFAVLAEVAGTAALAAVDKELQRTFVWFVMGFPVLLVILFFVTLNFNPKVFYSSSDFRDEENFLNTLIGTRNVSLSLDEITQQLEDAKTQILRQATEQITAVGSTERKKLTDILNRQLARIETRIESVRRDAEAVASGATAIAYPQSYVQARILGILAAQAEPRSPGFIASETGLSVRSIERAL